MAKVNLTSGFVQNPPACPVGRVKVDYYDTQLPGFLLEVRATGRCTYYQRYQDKYGRTKQARIGHPNTLTLEEARGKARQIKSQALMGLDFGAEQEKLKATPSMNLFFEEQYLPYVKGYKRSWKTDEAMYVNKIKALWGNMKLCEITRQDIELLRSNFNKVGFKPATINRYTALIKYIFSLAEKWEVIEKSPARDVSKLEENNIVERYLSTRETESLLKALRACKHTTVPDLIEFLIVTGARKGEATQAKWGYMDFEKGLWVVPLSKSGKSRQIVLSEAAMEILERRRGLVKDSEYVFADLKTGEPLNNFYWVWDRIRKAAGIPDVRIHDLRHNFASVLVNGGRSLYEVQKLLGHADMKTTQRYAHLEKSTLKEAVNLAQSRIYAGENGG